MIDEAAPSRLASPLVTRKLSRNGVMRTQSRFLRFVSHPKVIWPRYNEISPDKSAWLRSGWPNNWTNVTEVLFLWRWESGNHLALSKLAQQASFPLPLARRRSCAGAATVGASASTDLRRTRGCSSPRGVRRTPVWCSGSGRQHTGTLDPPERGGPSASAATSSRPQ
jgi:hypothetical protein